MSGTLNEIPPDQRGNDPLSPTAMIYNYLRANGQKLTPENVSRALQINMQQPGAIKSPDYNMPGAPMPVPLMNDVPVDSGGGTKRSSAPPSKPIDSGSWDAAQPQQAAPPDVPTIILPRTQLPGTGSLTDLILGGRPPPMEPAPVTPGGPPEMPPPPAGAEVAIPPPPADPLQTALSRAIPPELPPPTPRLALPAPEVPGIPQLPAPQAQPQLPAPPQLRALPAPETPPVPQIEAAPRAPMLEPPKAPLQLEGPPKVPPISPEAPVTNEGFSGRLKGAGRGAVKGAAKGAAVGGRIAGSRGAAIGGVLGGAGGALEGVAPEVIPYILKNLHLR